MADSSDAPLKKTPLHASHVALGARMVPFGGWDMPVEYSGITPEHNAVRIRPLQRHRRGLDIPATQNTLNRDCCHMLTGALSSLT